MAEVQEAWKTEARVQAEEQLILPTWLEIIVTYSNKLLAKAFKDETRAVSAIDDAWVVVWRREKKKELNRKYHLKNPEKWKEQRRR
jgi:hypothetical protein